MARGPIKKKSFKDRLGVVFAQFQHMNAEELQVALQKAQQYVELFGDTGATKQDPLGSDEESE